MTSWDPKVRLQNTGSQKGKRLKAPKRTEVDRETWADLDRIEYKFRMTGSGGAIAGPFMFGRGFEAPPHPTYSVVADLDLDGLEKCSAPIIYDQELFSDPTFTKLRSQIPSVTTHPAVDSEKRESDGGQFFSERFHFIGNADPFPVSGAESSLRIDDKHDIHYPVIPSVGIWGLEQIGWEGIPFYLDEDVAYESGWGLQCRIDSTTFFPASFPGGPNFYSQWSCGREVGGLPLTLRHIPVMGRVNPGDILHFSIWAWAGVTNAFWDYALIWYDQDLTRVGSPIGDNGPAQQVSTSRTKVTFDIVTPVPPHEGQGGLFADSGPAYWFDLAVTFRLPLNQQSSFTAQIDRVSITVEKGPYSLGLFANNHVTIGVAEWIRDDNDMYVGANLWCRAIGINPDVPAEAQVTFKGRVLKSYANIHFVEPKMAPTEVVLQ